MNQNTKTERIRQIQQLNKLLRKQIVQRYGIVAVGLLVVGSVAAFGLRNTSDSHAATLGSLSMTTASTRITTGAMVAIALREDTGTDAINAMQASVSYDPTKLQYMSMTEGGVFTTAPATSTGTPGVVRVGRAVSPGSSVTGANTVVTLNFKVLTASGTTSLTYDPSYSFLVSNVTNSNILSSTSGLSLTIAQPAPSISTISPASGTILGGTSLTISGSGFASGATVLIGGKAASNVVVQSSSTITANAPANVAGSVNVMVTNTDGQVVSKAAAYTYIDMTPTISSITPASGSTAGGTQVTITGTNFGSETKVSFDGSLANIISLQGSTQLIVSAPAHAAGKVPISVSGLNGTVSRADAYTYVGAAPMLTSLSSLVGAAAGGQTITLRGSNFVQGAQVVIGGSAATGETVLNSMTMTAIIPAHAPGVVSVTIYNPDQQSATLNNAFTYLAAGDVNGDGRVNALDLSTLLSRDGQNYLPADFNGDGVVGSADLAILIGKWTW